MSDIVGGPSWRELWANLAIFKDAIWVGGLAGALLGAIGVHVVLRRMVFASSAIAQAAALGVALSFWIAALVATATVLLLGGHAVLWRALLFAGYDPMGARVQGMPVRALNVFLFLSVGLSVALCTRALGALPVFAFSVLPAMTALALTARIGVVFIVATLLGAFSGVGGYVVSFKGDLPVGATQTATASALLAAALLFRFARARWEQRR